ncbi:MAG: hypothetical protein JXR49_21375 [Acidobacteria bacterium]|nr:hypothetical protein [Acidobacteriota bacterium]
MLKIALFLLWTATRFAVGGDFSLDGYIKSYLYVFQPAPVRDAAGNESGPSPEALMSNRLRLEASYRPSNRVRIDAAYDLAPRFQSEGMTGNSILFRPIDPFSYRVVDLETDLYPSDPGSIRHFTLGHNLDRAAVTVRSKTVDWTIGRQAIAWGSARVINPTDILAPFAFEALDTEDRIGIDAVRARVPLGTLSEIDAGYIFGRDMEFSKSAFYGRWAFNALQTDISFLFMGFRGNLLFGFDLARSIGGAGFWLETAYVEAGVFNEDAVGRERDYFGASTGLDYNLTGETYGFLEYHFNGAGASLAGEYMDRYMETAYTEGSVYLMGRHYLIPGIVHQYSPLVSITFQSLINVTDASVFWAPQAEYNIAQNVYLGAGAFVGTGKGPVLDESPTSAAYRSEFGGYPNIFFASLRRYF